MSEIIKVGMADLNVCVAPNGITTLGLGSCVGIALRDPVTKIGGLAHIMLPDSTSIRNNTNIPKFADTGILALIEELEKQGLNRKNLLAKIAGGATTAPKGTKTETAKSFDKSLAGTYTVTVDTLNIRSGAGKEKTDIGDLKKGTKAVCYGYYTKVDGVKWFLVVANGITGYVSSKYLKK